MADNTTLDPGSGGDTIATDDIGGVKFPRTKLVHGNDGVNDGDISTSNPLPVELTDNNQTAVADISAIKTAVEILDNAISGTEMQVDVVSSALPTGAASETTLDAIKTAVETLDNIVSGSEAQVDIVASLPAGTNAIGKLAANDGVDIGNVDVSSLPAELSGPGTPVIDSYTSTSISASANTANQSLVTAPGANKQIWVYGFVGSADTGAGSISLQDEDDAALSGIMPVAENGGFAVTPSGNFAMPWLKTTTNKALEIDTVTCGFKGVLSYAIVSV